MKQILSFLLFLLGVTVMTAQSQVNYSLIPQPVQMTEKTGNFTIGTSLEIYAPIDFKEEAELLKQKLLLSSDKEQALTSSGAIYIDIDEDRAMEKEAYKLQVTPEEIKITAADKKGAIHGIFTLIQLQQIQNNQQQIPAVNIKDKPAYAYRGMHLDVSRHFFPVSFIKKFIDMMALYKLNNFHWHLTDGAGWRLEIKKYPKLTQQAAWRTNGKKLNWNIDDERFLHEGDPDAYGGYYTQKEAREVVAYAATRGINVIPEIEMPGHSEEVLAVYPNLSCSGIPYKNSEYNVCTDSTYVFLKDVLQEVMDIFPSKYIHIGGDEASMESWKNCQECQDLMQEKGFDHVDQLQSHFIKKIDRFLTDQGRKMIGWDEILKGGLSPNATVMSWRGESGGIKAARQGHDVIMTPGEYFYFDHYQSHPNTQPKTISGYIPLRKVYRYNPLLGDELTSDQQEHILGVQANTWAEYIPNTDHMEYMIFPRMLALTEVGWTPYKDRDFQDFHQRLQDHYRLLQRHNINYYRPSYRIHVQAQPDYKEESYTVSFQTEQYKPAIFYTLDGTEPDTTDNRYRKPFKTSGKTTVKAAIFKEGKPMDSTTTFIANYHRAIGKKVSYKNGGWNKGYPAQKEKTLTNGITGGLTYQDKQWQGFLHDLDVVVDMEKETKVEELSIRFMQLIGPGVYIPNSVAVLLSNDGKHYHQMNKIPNDVSPEDSRLLFKTFTVDLKGKTARYIRVKATVQRGFMFTDEIIIN